MVAELEVSGCDDKLSGWTARVASVVARAPRFALVPREPVGSLEIERGEGWALVAWTPHTPSEFLEIQEIPASLCSLPKRY